MQTKIESVNDVEVGKTRVRSKLSGNCGTVIAARKNGEHGVRDDDDIVIQWDHGGISMPFITWLKNIELLHTCAICGDIATHEVPLTFADPEGKEYVGITSECLSCKASYQDPQQYMHNFRLFHGDGTYRRRWIEKKTFVSSIIDNKQNCLLPSKS